MRRRRTPTIDPENIFLDSSNLGAFDTHRFEGRVEKPVSPRALMAILACFALVAVGYLYRAYDLQVLRGDAFAAIAAENTLAHSLVFAERGILYDRDGEELAWNEPGDHFAKRTYALREGLGHVLGYVRYPKADAKGLWWRTEYVGVAGAEQVFNALLSGENGKEMVEVNALGEIERQHLVENPVDGAPVTLSIDASVQERLYATIAAHAQTHGFLGGASVIMDVETGELLALTSFPEVSPQALTDGEADAITAYNADRRTPFLDRAVSGAYTPGSIVKPLFAAAALNEGIIDAAKSIFSPGFISIPNPYDPERPTIMKDWKAHGWTNMREALAVSADVYFYSIGGGYDGQKGLGITKLDVYAQRFGLGAPTGVVLPGEVEGVIPTPEWKAELFDGDEWRLGDTYNTSIGQYGFQVTPVQMVRAIAAIANGGTLLSPQLLSSSTPQGTALGVRDEYLKVVREGMRLGVVSEKGTARALNVPGIAIAAKTGTAELGSRKQFMNSWVVGFWPADAPRYAFATVLERAPAGTLSGAAPGMKPFFEWLVTHEARYMR